MTTIHLAILGIGNVGSTLVNQIYKLKSNFLKTQGVEIKISLIANSSMALFSDEKENNWKSEFLKFSEPYTINDIIAHFKALNAENVIAVDMTASTELVMHYEIFIENGFHIVSANKIANTIDYGYYTQLRTVLKRCKREFLYETNVGAGLPIIETIRNLHLSGEGITKIKGVFSGSLSYIFNQFSEEGLPFHQVLNNAVNQGLTEPDPRDDLSGKDVARKLLILAREVGLKAELSDVKIESLIPKELNGNTTLQQFNKLTHTLSTVFNAHKLKLKNKTVLRYVGLLDVVNRTLEVKLMEEPKASPLGQLKGTDNLFEIYTESYTNQPLVIQGSGAGKTVTARGVLSDIIKLSRHLQKMEVGRLA